MQTKGLTVIAIGLLCWSCCLRVYADQVNIRSDEKSKASYTFAVVPQFGSKKTMAIWKPIIDELEKRTKLNFELIGTSDITSFEKKFSTGEFDFAYMNPYHVLKTFESMGYIPLVRDHGEVLQGILVVSKESKIKRIEELNGNEIAFPAPNALGASMLMRADLSEKFGISFKPIYVKNHSSVYLNVYQQLIVAGGGVMGTLLNQKSQIQNGLRIIYTTRDMPTHPITAHPRIDESDRFLVQQVLLEMAHSVEFKPLFAKIPIKQLGVANIEEYQVMSSWGLEKYYVE